MRSLFSTFFAISFLTAAPIAIFPVAVFAKVDTKTTAAVIVDMQEGFYQRGGVTGTVGLQNLVDKQIELLKWAVAENVPVLFFEYDGFGDTDTRLTSLVAGGNFMRVTKVNDDGFTAPSLKPAVKFLRRNKIKTLIMAGINGAYCVHDTTTGAISSGFDVVTASDIVGNLNQNPPIYPNNTWFFKNNKLEILKNLDAILY